MAIPIDCNPELPEPVIGYLRDSLADSSLRAYRSDLAQFTAWGGTIPASDRTLATYLAHHAESHSVATLTRWLASLAKAHRAAGLPSPTSSELVRATLRGIKRRKGTAQDQAAPLLRDDLVQVLNGLGDGLKDVRDRALLLLGFAGAFRRSELVGLDTDDLEPVRQGLIVHLRRSKTDPLGAGRKVGIPHGRTRHCPVAAVELWLSRSGITQGPLFRGLNRHGQLLAGRLSGEAVSVIVKERVQAAGYDPAPYSGHSLRAGFATSAAQVGVSSVKIRAQTGHASDAMLGRYIRDAELFLGNAALALL
ncbi:site-specific integrase [Methylobacterium nodulans]|uniref:site-specific integrase n=1 Tax=Methylobacterium nodulans TaxID=114616 RepID=UPI001FCA52FF|nr:site-specific integrase [Methylobacterium nodulans]